MRKSSKPISRGLLSASMVVALISVPGVGSSGHAHASGVFSGSAHSSAVTVNGVSGDISIREWLSAATGTHTGGTFSSPADASFSLVVPSSVSQMDVLAFGGGGGGGGGTQQNGNAVYGGGGGGGGGEVRRIDGLAVTPGETLTVSVGKAGARGAANTAGSAGGNTSLKRGSTTLLKANGGAGGQRAGDGRAGGSGGSGGTGGTLVSAGVDGRNGSNSTTSPADMSSLDNSGSSWVIGGLRVAAGGGGGGGRQVPGGSGTDYSIATRATTAASGFTATSNRIAGDGEGGNNAYATTSDGRINAFEYSGSGGGGGGAVFTNSGVGGGHGGSGGLIFSYVVADLDTSSLTAAAASIRANSSTVVTLQLKKDSVNADVSAGTVTFSVSGLSGASLSSVTDNGDGTYSATLSSGSTEGTATVTATIGGENFSDTASVTVSRISQMVAWSPPSSQTALELADSGFTIDTASTTGDGSLSYSVSNAGTTGCAIDGSRAVTFDSTGTCVLSASAAQTDTYSSAATTVSLTVSRGTFAISAPSSKVGTSSSSFTSVCTSSCDVSGFAAADEIRVVVSKSDGSALSGRVKLASTTGLTQSLSGYQSDATSASGFAELGFEGNQAEVNAALETLQYKSPSGGGDETIGISASLAGAAYFSGNGHYFEVVAGPVSFANAKTAAASRTFNGLNGYLATILSDAENRFIDSKLSTRSVWIGGEFVDTDSDGTEDSWKWVTGPVADQIVFRTSGGDVDGVFTEWEPGQPDGSGNCMATNYDGGDADSLGNWDDLDCLDGGSPRVRPYVVEYGGNGGTVLKEASNSFDVGAPTAPLQVSGLSATAGNGQLTLSWSAPGTGGSAITDYVVEQYDPDTATWNVVTDGVSTATSYVVSGLTNGTAYSFRVSAKNTIGTGTASSTVSGTPVVFTSSSGTSTKKTEPTVPAPVVTPTRPTVRLPLPPATPPRPTVLSAPVKSSSSVQTPVDRLSSRVGGVPAPVTTTTSGDDELSVSTSSMRLSLKMSLPGTVSTPTDDVSPELTIKPGAKASVSGSGLLPNTTVQVWLPNVSDRELGRLAVNADGELTGEVSLSSSLGEDPLPIGRQTLQVTGYDADGNQTVVEMPVNIAQGPPTPEPNRQVGALPDLSPGQSLATSAGVPTTVAVTPFAEQRIVAVDGGDWSLSVAVANEDGEVGGTSAEPLIRMKQSGQGSVTGEGFQPGTVASLWMFSDPTLLGTVTVTEDGSFNAEFLVDAQFLPVGEHTLQIQGVGTDGFIKAANLGVLIDEAPALTTADSALSMIWWVLAAVIAVALVIMVVVSRRRRQA